MEREIHRAMDSDEEDFLFVGTPIEREEDVISRKKKAVAEASSQLRTLPSWKQEVCFSFNPFFIHLFVFNLDSSIQFFLPLFWLN